MERLRITRNTTNTNEKKMISTETRAQVVLVEDVDVRLCRCRTERGGEERRTKNGE